MSINDIFITDEDDEKLVSILKDILQQMEQRYFVREKVGLVLFSNDERAVLCFKIADRLKRMVEVNIAFGNFHRAVVYLKLLSLVCRNIFSDDSMKKYTQTISNHLIG